MKVTVLGSGAWEGIPAPFCKCNICQSAIKKPKSKNNRTRPEFLVETKKGSFLLEASPDIRLQSTRFALPPVKDFFISHWHFDHMYGLNELQTWIKNSLNEKPTVYCSPVTKDRIDKEFGHLLLEVKVLQPFEQISLFGIKITPLPMYHMQTQDDLIPENKISNTYGYLLQSDDQTVAYLGDYYRLPAMTFNKIKKSDVLIADGTYLFTDSYNGRKPNHMHGDAILEFTKSTHAKKVYFHSISHLTKKTHGRLQKLLPKSHHITFDGMQI